LYYEQNNKRPRLLPWSFVVNFSSRAEPRQICEANSVKVCGVKMNDIEKLYRKPTIQSPSEHAASFLPEVTTL